jgi:uncharacterized protein
MDLNQLIEDKREEILQVAARHGAYNVRVFGSVARGEAGPDSDLDLLVDVGAKRTFFFPGGLIADLEDLLGYRVQVITENGLRKVVKASVMKEAIPL